MKSLRNLFFIILAVLFIMSCISKKQYAGDIDKIGEGNVIIVGCIELKPPLEEYEQSFWDQYRNRVYFSLEKNILEFNDSNIRNMNNFVEAILGNDFYIKKMYSKELYISCQLVAVAFSDGYLYLPGVFQIEVPQGCKVAYIGKIRYHRDIYSAITKVEIIDDYENAKSQLEEKYRKQVNMCRAKIKLIEQK